VKVDPFNKSGDPASGVIHTIQNEELGQPGSADNRLQAYCFRMCLTKRSENKIPFSKPMNYDRSLYEIYLRYEKAGGKLYTPSVSIPNDKTDLGAWHDLSHNLYGMNHEYPGGTYEQRDQILVYHRYFTHGLFYFLANDPEVTKETRTAWSEWGLAKDEFIKNEGWPRMFYMRDARRMVSDYVITEHHTRKTKPENCGRSRGCCVLAP
jgi:FAD dependent oxidoreductase